MKAASGEHWIALDHLRGLAALLVFVWHFTHSANGYPVPFAGAPALFPLALFDEGHVGVALFMTLSGYLFSKLLADRTIRWVPFFWNRILRLAPLLTIVMIAVGLKFIFAGGNISDYGRLLIKGFLLPVWPNNGWSIAVELHFYLILPVLLLAMRRNSLAMPAVILAAIALRLLLWWDLGSVQKFAYLSIIGRIDQFVLGIIAFQLRERMHGSHIAAGAVLVCFSAFYWEFDRAGGFYGFGGFSSSSPFWIVLPTIEGCAWGVVIAYYDRNFRPVKTGVSRLFALAGTYSYAIYLLHPFVVFHAAAFIHERVMDLTNFYVAFGWAIVGFVAMMPIGYLSYRFIERPFLRLRRPYVLSVH